MADKPPFKKLGANHKTVPTVSDGHMLLIGKAIVVWSKIEPSMDDTIWTFLKIDEDDGRLITNRFDARSKGEVLKGFANRHIKDKTTLSKFLDLLKRISDLQADRNFIAHGVWGTLIPNNIPIALSVRPKSEIGMVAAETFPEQRMQSIIDGMLAALNEMVEFQKQL